jgi:hypothetical protein
MVFSLIEVLKTKEDDYFLEWDMAVTDPPESIDDYKFQIWWSDDPISGFTAILDEHSDVVEIPGATGPLTYTHHYRQMDFNRDRYYKVQAIHLSNAVAPFFSSTVFIGMYSDGMQEVMKHAENTLNRMYQGEPCFVIKRKSTGARCPTCWSAARQQRMRTHCDTCHGTGFVVGYYQPIDVQISFDSDPKKSDLQKEWENVYDTKRARMSNYPLVRPKDLVVNKDDYKRYVISHVDTTKLPRRAETVSILSKQNYIVSQLLVLEELNPDDNEYFLDIDNIPNVPIGDEGQTGSTLPFFNDHKPVTTDYPLSVDANQHVTFRYNTDDFELVSGIFTLKGSSTANVQEFIAGEIISEPLMVLALTEDARVRPANVSDLSQVNMILGIGLSSASINNRVMVQLFGKLTYSGWTWLLGKSIFFDSAGRMTQSIPASNAIWLPVAKPIDTTAVEILVATPIIRR